MINLSCGQHMMLLNNTPVHVCCVDMAELSCVCLAETVTFHRKETGESYFVTATVLILQFMLLFFLCVMKLNQF